LAAADAARGTRRAFTPAEGLGLARRRLLIVAAHPPALGCCGGLRGAYMPARKTLLHAMLWSLGLTALTGVASVVFVLGDLVAKLVGTGLISAAGCGLLILLSALADREAARSAALAGMAGVVGLYVLGLMLLWEVFETLLALRVERQLGLTMLNLAWFTGAMMFALTIHANPVGRLGGRVGLVAIPAAFVSCLLAVWISDRSIVRDLFATGAALMTSGTLIMLTLIGAERRLAHVWRAVGVAAALVVLAVWLWGAWIGSSRDIGMVVFAVALTVAGLTALASLCLLCRLPREQRWVLLGTLGAAVATGIVIDVYVINELLLSRRFNRDWLARLASAAGILTSCGALALCVLVRLNRRMAAAPELDEYTELTATCPRCQRKQTLRAGRNACPSCGLNIEIRLVEPRCAHCNYLLYGVQAQRCPECGQTIAPV